MRRAPSARADLLGGSTPPGDAWPTQSQLEMVGGMMLEDLMHLTASLDRRAQSERCVSTIIFDACASSGADRRRVGGGYLWSRTSGEAATSPHQSVDEVRPRHEKVGESRAYHLKLGGHDGWPATETVARGYAGGRTGRPPAPHPCGGGNCSASAGAGVAAFDAITSGYSCWPSVAPPLLLCVTAQPQRATS